MDGEQIDGAQVEQAVAEAVRDREERERLQRRQEAAARALAELDTLVRDRATVLEAESRDVEQLESFSLRRIWAGLAGHRDADLDRESAEREAARYALAEAEVRRDTARREHDALVEQLRVLGDVDARYRAALEAKDAWIRSADVTRATRLAELAARRGTLLAQDRELAEAHAAGRQALEHLGHAADLLGSARSWSTWDTFGGGGLVTDLMKYDRIDQATAALRNADLALKAFSRELADVDMSQVRGVEVTPMMRTFDVFFDNIFSDFSVRARVQEAAQRTATATESVRAALDEVSRRGHAVRQEIAALDRDREDLLLR